MVVDFCAGAGGKTLALGALMRSEGRLYAFDTSDKPAGESQAAPEALRPVECTSTTHRRRSTTRASSGWPRKIDRVLVDAPCSGLGTLRRNPDLKWRQTPDRASPRLAVKQRAILAARGAAGQAGRTAGLRYLQLLREENEGRCRRLPGGHPRFRLAALRRRSCSVRAYALDTGQYFRVFPHSHGMDGFFAAVLERQAGTGSI